MSQQQHRSWQDALLPSAAQVILPTGQIMLSHPIAQNAALTGWNPLQSGAVVTSDPGRLLSSSLVRPIPVRGGTLSASHKAVAANPSSSGRPQHVQLRSADSQWPQQANLTNAVPTSVVSTESSSGLVQPSISEGLFGRMEDVRHQNSQQQMSPIGKQLSVQQMTSPLRMVDQHIVPVSSAAHNFINKVTIFEPHNMAQNTSNNHYLQGSLISSCPVSVTHIQHVPNHSSLGVKLDALTVTSGKAQSLSPRSAKSGAVMVVSPPALQLSHANTHSSDGCLALSGKITKQPTARMQKQAVNSVVHDSFPSLTECGQKKTISRRKRQTSSQKTPSSTNMGMSNIDAVMPMISLPSPASEQSSALAPPGTVVKAGSFTGECSIPACTDTQNAIFNGNVLTAASHKCNSFNGSKLNQPACFTTASHVTSVPKLDQSLFSSSDSLSVHPHNTHLLNQLVDVKSQAIGLHIPSETLSNTMESQMSKHESSVRSNCQVQSECSLSNLMWQIAQISQSKQNYQSSALVSSLVSRMAAQESGMQEAPLEEPKVKGGDSSTSKASSDDTAVSLKMSTGQATGSVGYSPGSCLSKQQPRAGKGKPTVRSGMAEFEHFLHMNYDCLPDTKKKGKPTLPSSLSQRVTKPQKKNCRLNQGSATVEANSTVSNVSAPATLSSVHITSDVVASVPVASTSLHTTPIAATTPVTSVDSQSVSISRTFAKLSEGPHVCQDFDLVLKGQDVWHAPGSQLTEFTSDLQFSSYLASKVNNQTSSKNAAVKVSSAKGSSSTSKSPENAVPGLEATIPTELSGAILSVKSVPIVNRRAHKRPAVVKQENFLQTHSVIANDGKDLVVYGKDSKLVCGHVLDDALQPAVKKRKKRSVAPLYAEESSVLVKKKRKKFDSSSISGDLAVDKHSNVSQKHDDSSFCEDKQALMIPMHMSGKKQMFDAPSLAGSNELFQMFNTSFSSFYSDVHLSTSLCECQSQALFVNKDPQSSKVKKIVVRQHELRKPVIFESERKLLHSLSACHGQSEENEVAKLSSSGRDNDGLIIQLVSCDEPSMEDAGKCVECTLKVQDVRSKDSSHQCRFYDFRKLQLCDNGRLISAGFLSCQDVTAEDLSVWLPPVNMIEPVLSVSDALYIIEHVGAGFCDVIEQEKAANIIANPSTIAWKRPVKGTREFCDSCSTSLFNIHWTCPKCGHAICIDCYNTLVKCSCNKDRCESTDADLTRTRIKTYDSTVRGARQAAEEGSTAAVVPCCRRCLKILSLCTRTKFNHTILHFMQTQIIPADALNAVCQQIHAARTKWHLKDGCPCGESVGRKGPTKGGAEQIRKLDISIPRQTSMDDLQLFRADVENVPALNSMLNEDPPKISPAVHQTVECDVNTKLFGSEAIAGDKVNISVVTERQTSELLPNGLSQQGQQISGASIVESSVSVVATFVDLSAGVGSSSGRTEVVERSRSPGGLCGSCRENGIAHCCEQKRKLHLIVEDIAQKKHKLAIVTNSNKNPCEQLTESIIEMPQLDLAETTPRQFLDDNRLLQLLDPVAPGNLQLFREQWVKSVPVMISNCDRNLNAALWHPRSFSAEFGEQTNDLVDCARNVVLKGHKMSKFWDGFECMSRRLVDREKREPMILKLKDWPPNKDFADVLPGRFANLLAALPLPEYTDRKGIFNLASRLPSFFVRPDLGPKMYNAYGSAMAPHTGSTNLHLDISDAVNLILYVGIPEDDAKNHEAAALRAMKQAGCCPLTQARVTQDKLRPGALWHIFRPQDSSKMREFLRKVGEERNEPVEPNTDPIHDQSWYLDEDLRKRLWKEYGVRGYTILQCLGDCIFIPAGAPHQVRNLHSCIKAAEDFVSPENVHYCFKLTEEFRMLSSKHSNHEDKLQIKNIIYHTVKDAVSVLMDANNQPHD